MELILEAISGDRGTIWKPGWIQASPGSPGITTKPPNKDKTFTHTRVLAHVHPALMVGSLGQPASPSNPGTGRPKRSCVGNSGNPRPPCCWDSAPHCHQLSFSKQKCASLYTAAGVRGRIRSRHLVSALARREITFVQGLEIRL